MLLLVEIVVGVAGQERREEEEELLVIGESEERLHWWDCSCLWRRMRSQSLVTIAA